jgi:hypothetical protein
MTTNNSTNNQLGQDQWKTATIDLSSPDIKSMSASPIPVIASPGPGKFIFVNLWLVEYFYNSIAYSGSTGLQLAYTTSLNALPASITTIFLSSVSKLGSAIASSSTLIPLADMVNNGISITSASPYTVGDGTARVYVKYSIKDAP